MNPDFSVVYHRLNSSKLQNVKMIFYFFISIQQHYLNGEKGYADLNFFDLC